MIQMMCLKKYTAIYAITSYTLATALLSSIECALAVVCTILSFCTMLVLMTHLNKNKEEKTNMGQMGFKLAIIQSLAEL